jgi:hypothetical protein
VALLILVLIQARRVSGLQRRIANLTRDSDGTSLETILASHLERVHRVVREVDELAARTAVLEGTAQRTLQHVALVRFNPFEDTGGNQSFALTIIDPRGDGLVISSLHARSGTRLYAKSIAGGTAETALSAEETEALRAALAAAAAAPGAGRERG